MLNTPMADGHSPCLELSMDTSASTLVLDVWELNKPTPLFRYERVIEQQRTHSALLVPVLKEALAQHKYTVQDLKALYFCQGPGSFTGLRASLSVVRTLGQFLPGLNLYAVDSLTRCLFQQNPHLAKGSSLLSVVMDARRQRVYTASFLGVNGHIKVLHPPELLSDAHCATRLLDLGAHTVVDVDGILPGRFKLPEAAGYCIQPLAETSAGEALRQATQAMPLQPTPWHTLDALYLQAPNVTVPTHLVLPTFEEMEQMSHD